MPGIKYEIVKKIGGLSKAGWAKELNLIRWNDREPKYDLRDWFARSEEGSSYCLNYMACVR